MSLTEWLFFELCNLAWVLLLLARIYWSFWMSLGVKYWLTIIFSCRRFLNLTTILRHTLRFAWFLLLVLIFWTHNAYLNIWIDLCYIMNLSSTFLILILRRRKVLNVLLFIWWLNLIISISWSINKGKLWFILLVLLMVVIDR